MVKQGIKNYFIGLKFFFTPLGTMFLGMMIGVSILIPGIAGGISQLTDGIKELAVNVNLDFNALLGEVWTAVRALDWDDPAGAIQTMLSAAWINEQVTQALHTLLGTDFDSFSAEVVALVSRFTETVVVCFVMFIVFWVLGFIAGFFIVKFQIRKNIAKRSLWKLILASVLDSVLTAVFVVAAAFLFSLWQWSILISAVLLILLVGCIALLEAYLLYGRGKMELKSIVNLKNAGLYALTDAIIFLISIALTLLACVINPLMGLFVGLTLIEIAAIVIHMNAESYVKSLAAPDQAA